MIKGRVPLYYKCQFCGIFKEVVAKRKVYCSTSCTMKAYYRRKKAQDNES